MYIYIKPHTHIHQSICMIAYTYMLCVYMYVYMHVYVCHNFIHQPRKIFEGSIYSNSIKERKPFNLHFILYDVLVFQNFQVQQILQYAIKLFNMLIDKIQLQF